MPPSGTHSRPTIPELLKRGAREFGQEEYVVTPDVYAGRDR
jgi:hypothetical protein